MTLITSQLKCPTNGHFLFLVLFSKTTICKPRKYFLRIFMEQMVLEVKICSLNFVVFSSDKCLNKHQLKWICEPQEKIIQKFDQNWVCFSPFCLEICWTNVFILQCSIPTRRRVWEPKIFSATFCAAKFRFLTQNHGQNLHSPCRLFLFLFTKNLIPHNPIMAANIFVFGTEYSDSVVSSLTKCFLYQIGKGISFAVISQYIPYFCCRFANFTLYESI